MKHPIEELCRLYEQGLTIKSISERIGKHPSSVRKRLLRAGVRFRKRGLKKPLAPETMAKIKQLYQQGHSCREIGEYMGWSKEKVRYWLALYAGIILRAKGGRRVKGSVG